MATEEAQLDELMQMLRCYEKARSEGAAPENLELEALLSAMKQHESKTDPSIKLTAGSAEDLDDARREEILPRAFFVVKSFNEKKQKAFINICGSDKIPGPVNCGDSSDLERALASLETSDETVNLRLPLSCSDPVISTDHRGEPCHVYDVVYNLSVVEVAMDAQRLKAFIVETAMTWISQKYNTQLNSDFKLPNMKYKGDSVRTQCIRAGAKGPLISEVPDVEAELEPSFPLLAKPQAMKLQESCSQTKEIVTAEATDVDNPLPEKSQSGPNPVSSSACSHPEPESPSAKSEHPQPEPELEPKTVAKLEFQPEPEPEPELHAFSTKSDLRPEPESFGGKPEKVDEEAHTSQEADKQELPVPLVQTEYIGRPVEFAFLHISFPAEVQQEHLQISATSTRVCVKAKGLDLPLEVSLLFPVWPEDAEVELSSSSNLVTMKLPYRGYKSLYCCC